MPMPSINVSFHQAGIDAIVRSEKGIVAMILEDAATAAQGGHVATTITDLTSDSALKALAETNKQQIRNAFLGYVTPPRKIIIFVIDGTETTLDDALTFFVTEDFDYLVGPPDIEAADATTISIWVKSERLKSHTAKTVLPHTTADHEGIVNFDTEDIGVDDGEYTTAGYCARIAGLLAGTPMTRSATFAPLPEVTSVKRLTDEQMDDAVDAGKFIIFYDGKMALTGRAVNSLTTTGQDKGNKFKKIKIVEVMDMIQNDIRTTGRESYIGKHTNSYDNKLVLVTAIEAYFEVLRTGGLIQSGYSVEIDVDANELYLKSQGIDTSEMTAQEIKEADTGSTVFLTAKVGILDAIEDIVLPIRI